MKTLFLLAVIFLGGCTMVTPEPGEQAVLVERPLLFGHGGVDPDPISTGRTIAAFTTDAVYVDMKPLQYDLRVQDMMSSDGVPLHFDATIRFQVTDSVKLVTKFGPEFYKKNVEQEFFNQIRQEIRRYGMNDIAINTQSVEDVDKKVSAGMKDYFARVGLPLELIAITVGKVSPPDAVRDQRIETATQEQRINTEHQRKLAEDSRKAAEQSRALADDAYRQAMQLSPAQFVQLEQIKMLQAACGGPSANNANCTLILTNGSVPTLSVK